MPYTSILTEKRGHVLVMTLNRPDRMNAWTLHMGEELGDAIIKANADPDIGAIVMTGSGRAFCAGADIEQAFKAQIDSGGAKAAAAGEKLDLNPSIDWTSLARESKPLIAAVNGVAIGIGVTMILPFDVIIAAEEAKFGMAFTKMGLVPELASSHFLVSRMGWGNASEFMLSSRIINGREAKERGLCEFAVPAADLMTKTFEIADSMADNPSPQMRMTKQLLTQNACTTDLAAAQAAEVQMLRQCYASAEHKEAVDAFLNKRKPDFRKLAS